MLETMVKLMVQVKVQMLETMVKLKVQINFQVQSLSCHLACSRSWLKLILILKVISKTEKKQQLRRTPKTVPFIFFRTPASQLFV